MAEVIGSLIIEAKLNAQQITATLRTMQNAVAEDVKTINQLSNAFGKVTTEVLKLGAVAFGTGFGLAALVGPETQTQLEELKILFEEIGFAIDGDFANALARVTRFVSEHKEGIISLFIGVANAVSNTVDLLDKMLDRLNDVGIYTSPEAPTVASAVSQIETRGLQTQQLASMETGFGIAPVGGGGAQSVGTVIINAASTFIQGLWDSIGK